MNRYHHSKSFRIRLFPKVIANHPDAPPAEPADIARPTAAIYCDHLSHGALYPAELLDMGVHTKGYRARLFRRAWRIGLIRPFSGMVVAANVPASAK